MAKRNETVCCNEDARLPENAHMCTSEEITVHEDEMAVLVNGMKDGTLH
jgi:hypothetical protein